MKIAVGSDHAGFEHKQFVEKTLRAAGFDVQDFGAQSTESYDYPDAAKAVADAVASGKAERGVLVCGTGIGMSISANKVRGIRAALAHDEYTAEKSRQHNDANVLCMGARVIDEKKAADLAKVFLKTPFEGGRHQLRVDKMMKLDKEEC